MPLHFIFIVYFTTFLRKRGSAKNLHSFAKNFGLVCFLQNFIFCFVSISLMVGRNAVSTEKFIDCLEMSCNLWFKNFLCFFYVLSFGLIYSIIYTIQDASFSTFQLNVSNSLNIIALLWEFAKQHKCIKTYMTIYKTILQMFWSIDFYYHFTSFLENIKY